MRRVEAIRVVAWAIVFLALITIAQAQQDSYLDEHPTKRLALVIGNSGYLHQARIPSSATDAQEVTKALWKMGFDTVDEAHEVKNSAEFWNLYFLPFISKINENDFALLYFSGHGLSYGGENFIAMLEAQETIPESQALNVLIPVSSLRSFFSSRNPGVSLFLLDSCRTIAGGIKKDTGVVEAISKGFTQIPATPENVLIGFSSDFGRVSKGRDEASKMSYYTDALLKFIPEDNKEFQHIKKQTRLRVIFATNGEQIPWFSESASAEVYLRPSKQILEQEKTAWLSRLATNDFEQIWNFTIEYAVSRYVAAAKRWLADFGKRQSETTKVSPRSLDAAWSTDPTKPISVRRIDGPFAFRKIANFDAMSATDSVDISDLITEAAAVSANTHDTAKLLADHGSVVVTRAMTARTSPGETSPSLTTIRPGTTVKITSVADDSQGQSWLQIETKGGDAYLPAARAVIGKTNIGFSLQEIEVSPSDGLQSLVNDRPILDALAELRAKGRKISRISVSAPNTKDQKLRPKLSGRLAHVVFVLEQAGISRSIINASGTETLTGENIRVRFFGN